MPIISASEFKATFFDYIIVGGGTTGLALAVRLSENPNITVGVIEAGAYDPNVLEINAPGLLGRIVANPKYDYVMMSKPQKYANNRSILQPRGKALGGSSMLNFECWSRPVKEEYDVLEEFGNKGWNWDKLLECCKRSETILPHSYTPEMAEKLGIGPKPEFHGTDGPIKKSFPIHTSDFQLLFIDALVSMGVPRNPEPAGGKLVGSFTSITSVDSRVAKRSYAASDYYEPNSGRRNLLVLTEAYVTKVLLEDGADGSKKCTGIEFVTLQDSSTHSTLAPTKDVIISGGTFKTPQILELSGIGNKETLAKLGIECKINLPGVGENLQDHLFVPTIAEIDEKFETLDALAEHEILAKHMQLYKEGKGYFASLTSPVFGFMPAASIVASSAEIETWQQAASAGNAKTISSSVDSTLREGLKKQFDVQQRWLVDPHHPQAGVVHFYGHYPAPPLQPQPGKRYATFLAAISHPFSRGSVHISTTDPLTQPDIDPNYLSNPADLEILSRAVDFVLRMWEAEELKAVVKEFVMPKEVPSDGAERMERIKEHIRKFVTTVFHPVGTAAMLPREDGGVVDAELKVYGTSNLRVVDLSILPLELSCLVQSTAYAIAEFAAEIIRGTV